MPTFPDCKLSRERGIKGNIGAPQGAQAPLGRLAGPVRAPGRPWRPGADCARGQSKAEGPTLTKLGAPLVGKALQGRCTWTAPRRPYASRPQAKPKPPVNPYGRVPSTQVSYLESGRETHFARMRSTVRRLDTTRSSFEYPSGRLDVALCDLRSVGHRSGRPIRIRECLTRGRARERASRAWWWCLQCKCQEHGNRAQGHWERTASCEPTSSGTEWPTG